MDGLGEGHTQLLSVGGITPVVRIGDTVRRPVRPFTATVHAYLAYLRTRGFTAAPKPLGYDDEGREVLSYVQGDVPHEPLPDYCAEGIVLVKLARLVRRLHDAAEGWVAPDDAVFGAIPGTHSDVVPLFDEPELVSHQDYCPGNVVFRHGEPAAFIDFDLARPTTRVADVVNALYWWAPLLHPADRAPAFVHIDVPQRVRLFADAYGLSADQRSKLVTVAVWRNRNAHLMMRAAADVDPVFRRWWDEGVRERMPRAEAWITEVAQRLNDALLAD